MATNVDEIIRKLPAGQRRKVEIRAAKLVLEGETETDAHRPMDPKHDKLQRALNPLLELRGPAGRTAAKTSRLLRDHFQIEQQDTLPPPDLLKLALKAASHLREHFRLVLQQHSRLLSSSRKLLKQVPEVDRKRAAAFARQMGAHAKTDRDVLYPASVLVEEFFELNRKVLGLKKARRAVPSSRPGASLDALKMLKTEHKAAKEALEGIAKSSGAQRRRLFERFEREIGIHDRIEYQVVYRALLAHPKTAAFPTLDKKVHVAMEAALVRLKKLSTDDKEWMTAFTAMRKALLLHIADEDKYYVAVKRELSAAELCKLGETMEVAKRSLATVA